MGCSGFDVSPNRSEYDAPLVCRGELDASWIIPSELAVGRRNAAVIDLFALGENARIVVIGKLAGSMGRRFLFDSKVSCSAKAWKPCPPRTSCPSSCVFVIASWMMDFSVLEVILESTPTDFCTSQYIIRMEYEAVIPYLQRDSESLMPANSNGGVEGASNSLCPEVGIFRQAHNSPLHICSISSRDMMYSPALTQKNSDDNNFKPTALILSPILNCTDEIGGLVRPQMQRRSFGSMGNLSAEMPFRLVFAVGFIVLVSGLYSARRWRTLSNGSSSEASTAAMLRLSSMWRYRDRYRMGMTPFAFRSARQPYMFSHPSRSEFDRHAVELTADQDEQINDIRLQTTSARLQSLAPPSYSSSASMAMPNSESPPSYEQVVSVASPPAYVDSEK